MAIHVTHELKLVAIHVTRELTLTAIHEFLYPSRGNSIFKLYYLFSYMKIGIIGAGKMGLGIGKLWAAKGHHVFYSDLIPDNASKAAAATGKKANHCSVRNCAAFGAVLLLSVPYLSVYKAIEPLINDSAIKNKILI